MIQLALAIAASAHEGANFAGPRIERHKSHLGPRRGLACFFPGRIPLGQEFINLLHPLVNRGGGSALQAGIESRIDPVALALQVIFREFLEKMVLYHVHKVGRGAAVDAAADE